ALVGVPGTSSTWLQSAFSGQLVTMGGTATIGVDTGATVDVAASVNISSTLTKLLPGTLRLSGNLANIGAGGYILAEGTTRLAKAPGVDAFAGGTIDVSANNDFGGQDADVMINEANEQINAAANVRISTSGLWDLNGFTESLGNGSTGTVLTMFT